MSYQALYRKFRPTSFDGVIGQEHIVRTLKNEIISDMVSHAYLFCGTRGTGKTSTAKIFAKAINCTSPINGEPCGECVMCKSAQEGRGVNIIEIDAASNNGVDNIRDIREEVKYPPTEGRYKVYIIDEVHMLSAGAFNALLKTLEEPPAHVIFILATTDPQKVPVTILSRCQRFDFRRISSGEIAQTLKKYTDIQNVDVEYKALETISRQADGSMRDALSILDQCIAFYNNEIITEDKVFEVCGAVDNSVFFDMLNALISKNAQYAVNIVDDIVYRGRDITQFVISFIEHLRNILVVSTVNEPENVIDMSQEGINKLTEQSKKVSSEEAVYFIRVFSQLVSNMKYSANQRTLLEVEIIKLCADLPQNNIDYVLAKIANIEKNIKEGAFFQKETVVLKNENTDLKMKQAQKPKNMVKAVPEDIKNAINMWKGLFADTKEPYKSLFDMTFAEYMEDERITVVCEDSYKDLIESKKSVLLNDINTKLKKEFNIKIISKSEYDDYKNINGVNDTLNTDESAFFNAATGMFSDADIID